MTTDMMNAPGPGEPSPAAGENDKQVVEDKITAFVPMEIFGDKTPEIGKVCTFKVIDVSEDGQVEIEYAHEAEGSASYKDRPEAPWEKDEAEE